MRGGLSVNGDKGWFGSRNLFLHEMLWVSNTPVCPFPHLAPRCSFSIPAVYLLLGLGGGWDPFFWGDCLSLGSWLSHRLTGQGS